ncbi:MAG: GntR family transcriptional regulator [Anaerolineales bacterium]|jgi:DNA-binding GntR family transcriptional regulator
MKPTNAEKAYTQIKGKIITAEMPPGSVINEAQLMEEFALGRTPIREAIKQLQSENLVMVTPRKGMFVADIAVTDLLQIFEVRVELESFATRLAAERITEGELTDLQKLAKSYQEVDISDKEALIKLDGEFHALLANATHNKFLIKEIEYYYNLSLRIWYIALNYAKPNDIDVDAHIEILDAIQARDEAKAGLRMRQHIQDFHKTIKQYI